MYVFVGTFVAGVVLIKLIDMKRPSLVWVVPLPRQRVLNWVIMEK